MRLIQVIKRHPVLNYCVFVMLWSFSWWALILTVVPVGTAVAMPMHPAAVLLMVVGLAGPILAALSLTHLIDGKGSVGILLGRLKHWRVGWWWLALVIPYVLNLVLYVEYAEVQGGVDPAQIAAKIGPAIGIGLTAGLFEEVGWRGFLLPRL